MVFFTCSHCGESVKKPSVAKHYMTKCRQHTPFLTCVDCLKDFKGNEYEAHTKCFTEEERYSAKGFVPKASSNKGERKQKAWSECVQGLLSSGSLKNEERNFLQSIVKFDNIPRKKVKFINFLTTTARSYVNKPELIDSVWEKLENYFKEANSDPSQKSEPNGEKAECENSDNSKSKRKHDDMVNNEEPSEVESERKKKKNKHLMEDEVTMENGNEDEGSRKESKKKKKSDESCDINGDGEELKNKKKKKSKHSDENKEEKLETEDKENISEKKKKKKQAEAEEKEETETLTVETLATEDHSFNWTDTILSVLSTVGTDNQITLKKLQKKVLKKYSKTVGCEINEKTIKKFSKKLKKVNGISVNGELVSLSI